MSKLTLSADRDLVKTAKRLAKARKTSVSGLFGTLVRAIDAPRDPKPTGPITRKATGLISARSKKSDRQNLEDALIEKYGL